MFLYLILTLPPLLFAFYAQNKVKSKNIELTQTNIIAFQVWQLMDDKMDWIALNSIAEYKEITDVDSVISSLLVIKDFIAEMKAAQ